MENASKALLIAGAILICILLIAIGMYIYNSAQSTIQTAASQMSQREKDMYNAPIKRYTGDSKKGSEVKQMIEEIISQNNQYVNESGKFISVHNGEKTKKEGEEGKKVASFKNSTDLDTACNAANVYEDPENGENTQQKIDNATDWMRIFKQKISAGKNYKVDEAMKDGIIYAVYISPI